MRHTRNLCSGIYSAVKVNIAALKPRYLWLEVTDRCNSRCEYCSIHQKPFTKDPLSPDETRRILSDSLFRNVGYVINSGGEPTVRSDLLEVLLAEHEALPRATLQLSTNGLLPERTIAMVAELQRRCIDVEVGVSLDGVGSRHDAIRGVKGNFEKVDHLVKKLVQMNARVSLGATLINKNLADNLQAREYARALNVPFMYHWFNTSGFYGNEQSDRASSYRKANGMLHAVETAMPQGPYKDMWLNELNGIQPRFRCFALNSFAVLKCSGDVAPCLSLWNSTIGNMRTDSPAAVWHSQKAKETRTTIRNCRGCLNSWGVCWSLATSYYPNLIHKVKTRLFAPKMQCAEPMTVTAT